MAVYRIKRFSYQKEKYQSFKDRIRETSVAGLFGAALGVIPGVIFGSLLPVKGGAKYGAIIGAALGAYGVGKMNWKLTSKEEVDKRNKKIEERQKRDEEHIRNSRPWLKPVLDKNPLEYRKLEMHFPQEFYKLIQINKMFIPIAEKYIKENKTLWWPKFVVTEPRVLQSELNDDCSEHIIMLNPEQADDTWIVWYPETGTYDFDISGDRGRFSTLKEALIEALETEIEFADDSYLLEHSEEEPRLELDRIYLDFIRKKL